MTIAFALRRGALLLEAQDKDGRWSTFTFYRLTRRHD
jgi:hypothetical protein